MRSTRPGLTTSPMTMPAFGKHERICSLHYYVNGKSPYTIFILDPKLRTRQHGSNCKRIGGNTYWYYSREGRSTVLATTCTTFSPRKILHFRLDIVKSRVKTTEARSDGWGVRLYRVSVDSEVRADNGVSGYHGLFDRYTSAIVLLKGANYCRQQKGLI